MLNQQRLDSQRAGRAGWAAQGGKAQPLLPLRGRLGCGVEPGGRGQRQGGGGPCVPPPAAMASEAKNP
jgi:hypothetical protein